MSVKFNLMGEKVLADLKQGIRADGRSKDDYRKIQIIKNISQNADGSARVKIGETDVLCGVKMVPMEPYPDSPDQGTISVMVELLALASPEFEVGPPSEESIEIARVADRALREGHAIDFHTLVIEEGKLAWTVFVDLYVLNQGGNLFDACALSGLVALLETRIPKLDGDKIVKGEYAKKLKLSSLPVLSTIGKAGPFLFSDSTIDEEKVMDARLSVGCLEDESICAMQKGGKGSFTSKELDSALEMAFRNTKLIRKML